MRSPKMLVVGGGTGGSITVGSMLKEFSQEMFRWGKTGGEKARKLVEQMLNTKFLLADTFKQTLLDVTRGLSVPSGTKIFAHTIGEKVTSGKGAWKDLEIGKKACDESWPFIKPLLDEADFIFLVTGLSGGTGSALLDRTQDHIDSTKKLFWPAVINPCLSEGSMHYARVVQPAIDRLKEKKLKFVDISTEAILNERVPVDEIWKRVNQGAAQSLSGVISLFSNPAVLTDPHNLWLVLGGEGRLRIGSHPLARGKNEKLDLNQVVGALRKSINNPYHHLGSAPGETIVIAQIPYAWDLKVVEDAVDVIARESKGDISQHVIPIFAPEAGVIAITSGNKKRPESPTIDWMQPTKEEIKINFVDFGDDSGDTGRREEPIESDSPLPAATSEAMPAADEHRGTPPPKIERDPAPGGNGLAHASQEGPRKFSLSERLAVVQEEERKRKEEGERGKANQPTTIANTGSRKIREMGTVVAVTEKLIGPGEKPVPADLDEPEPEFEPSPKLVIRKKEKRSLWGSMKEALIPRLSQ